MSAYTTKLTISCSNSIRLFSRSCKHAEMPTQNNPPSQNKLYLPPFTPLQGLRRFFCLVLTKRGAQVSPEGTRRPLVGKTLVFDRFPYTVHVLHPLSRRILGRPLGQLALAPSPPMW